MTDGPRTPRTSLIVASLLSIVLAGCLGAGPAARAEAPTTYAFPEPARGGRWRLRLADGGQEVSTVQLVGSREYARDGTRRHAPVLRISSDPLRLPDGIHFQTRYWVHQLGPQGVVDTRAEADLVSDVGGTTSRIEMDLLDGVPDPGHDRPFASAYLYGPGLWGRTLTVGEPVAVPEAMVSGWDRETGPPFFEVTSVSGGCATVRADAPSLALRVEADLVFCDGPLPERIDVLSPARRSYVVDRIHVGDPSPDPVSNTVPLREPVGTFPPDGSDLPFPLDEAADAIHAHPATTAWLDRHPDARAVQGRLTATACRVHDGTVTAVPGTCPDLYRARALEWRVVLASPDDAGIEVTARKVVDPVRTPASVVEVVPVDRNATGTAAAEAVPLRDALASADRVRGDEWKRLAVGFWTHGAAPWWSIQGQRRADTGSTFAGPVNVYWADGRLEGFVSPLG